MTPEQEQDKYFLEARIAECRPVIRQAKMMQRGWIAGGKSTEAQLNACTEQLASWLAVEEDLKKQLTELESTPIP